MRTEELQALLDKTNKEIAEVYPRKFMELMMDVFEKGLNTGIKIGIGAHKDTPRMIPVKERLPLENQLVLCRMKSNEQIVSGYLYKKDGKVCVATDPNFEFEDYGDYEATHWYPMLDVVDKEE